LRQAAIVILGAAVKPDGTASRALRDRVMAALAWGEMQDPKPLYVPTGAVGRFGPAESAVMAGLLRQAGVEAERILEEPTGTDTFSSAVACIRLLRARGHAGPLRVATHRYHLPRGLALFRIGGMPAEAVPPPPGPAATGQRRRWFWRLREVPALPYDAALMALARARRRL
jgi:uncharacterized SAM-binding protein YcdF (DUF218 family)